MPSEPRWITIEEAIWINQQVVFETGESHHLREQGLLASALARPRNRWSYAGEEDVLALAASLLFGLAKNHPFEQGNKRTAAVAALMFIEINGYEWVLPDNGEFARWVLALINGQISEQELADRMAPHVR